MAKTVGTIKDWTAGKRFLPFRQRPVFPDYVFARDQQMLRERLDNTGGLSGPGVRVTNPTIAHRSGRKTASIGGGGAGQRPIA